MGRKARKPRHPSTSLSATVALVKIGGLDLGDIRNLILEPLGGLHSPRTHLYSPGRSRLTDRTTGCPLETHSPNLESQAQGLHIITYQRPQSDESPLNQRHQGYCRTRRNALEKQKKPGSQARDRPICGDIRLPAPLPHAPEDLEDFQQNLQALASTVEELDNTFDELQTADSPQETTSAVEMLDEASPPAAEPSTT